MSDPLFKGCTSQSCVTICSKCAANPSMARGYRFFNPNAIADYKKAHRGQVYRNVFDKTFGEEDLGESA